MGVDPNRRESSTIDRRLFIGQDGDENKCSSRERVRAAIAGCSVFANGKLPDPKGNPYQARVTVALIAVAAATDVNAAV